MNDYGIYGNERFIRNCDKRDELGFKFNINSKGRHRHIGCWY